ncbi:hypothetical protein ACIQOU_15930 [Streptomyces sp. NPDC091279]|uniref:hypothetical protein n=1 Tax=Streptomyces sp. NPDC091279 TaxID=3365983 RepID=UPI00381D9035
MRPTHHRPARALAITALALLLTSCGTDQSGGNDDQGAGARVSPSPSASARDCAAPPAQLGAGDSGRTVCVAAGGVVRVSLDGGDGRPWKPLAVSGTGLRATNSGIVLRTGDASGAFEAVAAGTTTRLTSTRPLCATKAGQLACQGLQEWSLTVIVK